MRPTALPALTVTAMMALALGACGDKGAETQAGAPNTTPAPSVTAPTPKIAEKPTTRDEPPFTVACSGTYNFKPLNEELRSGSFRFDLTVEPRLGRYYMSNLNWGPHGTAEINEQNLEINEIEEITSDRILLQRSLVLNRRTGKFSQTYEGPVTGACSRALDIPIPTKAF
jgi:hypothetical protein